MKSRVLLYSFLAVLGLAVTVSYVSAQRSTPVDAERSDKDRRDRDDDDDDNALKSDDRVRVGLDLAPVRLNLKGKKRNMVGLGSYIVNAQGACNDCHTCPTYEPGTDPYNGDPVRVNARNYLAGGVAFGPTIKSANLTPNPSGLPAGLTRDQFISAIRTGHDPHEGDILQVMPWPVYRNMVDRDLKAIYAYLTAIPHAEPGNCEGPGTANRRR